MIGEMAVRLAVYIFVIWVAAKLIVGEGGTFRKALLAGLALTATSLIFLSVAENLGVGIPYLIYVVDLLILKAIFDVSLGGALLMMIFTWVGGMLVRLAFQ